jgi:hypothetical protein
LKKIKIRRATFTDAESLGNRGKSRIPARESSWMMPVSSYIVILNLIATLSFLYHKSEKHAVIRID